VEGAFEMLQTLYQRGYKLYAASNSFGHLQRKRLELAGVLPFFEGTYISMDIGYDKPDGRFYDFALNDAQLSADEVLMVGDSMTTDIIGAQRVGIDTCWFNPTNRPIGTTQPTYEIHDLLSLLTVLP
jgi:2-haloacid dehalogenase